MKSDLPEDVIKFASLMQEIQNKWPQLLQSVMSGADQAALRVIMERHGLNQNEFDQERLLALERHVQALRQLPVQSPIQP